MPWSALGEGPRVYPIGFTRLISVRNQLQQWIRYRTLPLNFAYLEAAVFHHFEIVAPEQA